MDSFLFQKASALLENVNKVIIGKENVVSLSCAALLAGGHLLIEDIPGVGKTILALAIARSIGGKFQRIQFTADLLPSDITGVNVFRQDRGEFSFRPGPIFCNILLADEINRATPRTQSSLLEAMEEHRVTVEKTTYSLPSPFFVIATQNPIELEGTYPLPFSQLDRFMTRVELGYLDSAEEIKMVKDQKLTHPIDSLSACMDTEEIVKLQKAAREVKIEEDLYKYIVRIIHATRETETLEYGASPRASIHLLRMAQAFAILKGRDYILPDDVKTTATFTLCHRVISGDRRVKKEKVIQIIREIIDSIEIPV